ncbi:MAG: TolB family protein [Planctomycetota bacterium]|jgi:Tol biopolymer transport system component
MFIEIIVRLAWTLGRQGVIGIAAALLAATSLAVAAPPGGGNGNGNGNGNGGGGGGGGGGDPVDREIAFNDGGNLVAVAADGSGAAVIVPGAGDQGMAPSWSPDGSQLVFNGDMPPAGPGIYSVDADGGNLRLVVTVIDGLGADPDWSPVESPDGGYRIVFADVPSPGEDTDLFAVNPDGTGLVNLTGTPGRSELEPRWSPDATRIVATTIGVPEDPTHGLFDCLILELGLVDGAVTVVAESTLKYVDGGPLWNAFDVWDPDWGPTSDEVVLEADGVLWRVDPADPAGASILVGGGNASLVSPRWGPGDAHLVYRKNAAGAKQGIFTLELATGASTKLSRYGRWPAWRR